MKHPKLKNFLFDAERGFVFVYVPKVACSNWKCIMRYLAGYEDYLDTSAANDRANNGLTYLSDFEDPWAILNDPGIKKISCVRDPFSRTLSAYLNKIEHRLSMMTGEATPEDFFLYCTEAVDKYRNDSMDTARHPKTDLEVFLRWLIGGPKWMTENEHWLPQSTILVSGKVQYDFIGRFENLQADGQTILDMMGCDIPLPTQTEIKFAPTNANQKLMRYYSPTEEALVRQIFAADFDAFGYPDHLSFLQSAQA